MKYLVVIKQCYRYEDVEAKSKKQAIQKVLDMEWRDHDEQDQPLEIDCDRQ